MTAALVAEFRDNRPIVPVADGSWSPAEYGEDGLSALMWPCFDPWHELFDIVAWSPARPGFWWCRTLQADMLGDYPWSDRPIDLVECPQQWLEGDRRGVCVLNWSTDVTALFWGQTVRPCSQRLARRLAKAIARQPAVNIVALK